MKGRFLGYHSEWNLGSPGGWDYQRLTQQIGVAVWERLVRLVRLVRITPSALELDFLHPKLYPINGFVAMLKEIHRQREGHNPGLVAVVAEEETLEDVVENRNLAARFEEEEGFSGALMAPHELEIKRGRVCYRGRPVSVVFLDMNNDVLLTLHRKYRLQALFQAIHEKRVINPRGTTPINAKCVFEVITDPATSRHFCRETIKRTPWTRRFFPRRTTGPNRESIPDLVEWTRSNWHRLVLKPEHGYSGKGVYVLEARHKIDDVIDSALRGGRYGQYIVQDKIPLSLWAERMPELDMEEKSLKLVTYQTDFRCLFGRGELFGFLGRYGHVPTNVGSGGGVQPLAVLRSDMSVGEATSRINETVCDTDFEDVLDIVEYQKKLALERRFTYLLGPIKIALRPRLITPLQMRSLEKYCNGIWNDCVTLEKMWLAGALDDLIKLEPEELELVKAQPWGGSPAIFASDGLFSFGAFDQ